MNNQILSLEIRRQIFHMLIGISFIFIIILFPFGQILLFVVFIMGLLASFLSTQYNLPIVHHFLCSFERKCNKNFPGRGVLFFFMGALLTLQLFERNIALASIIILTFADPISHFVGSNFGKISSSFNRKKKIEGTLAGILAGTAFASFLVPIWLSFTGSLFAMVLELAGIKMGNTEIDDNLLIPLVSGTIMHLMALI